MLRRAIYTFALVFLVSGCAPVKPEGSATDSKSKAKALSEGFYVFYEPDNIPREDLIKCMDYCYEGLKENPRDCELYLILRHCYQMLAAPKEAGKVEEEAKLHGCTLPIL